MVEHVDSSTEPTGTAQAALLRRDLDGLTREQLKSLWLHRQVILKLLACPDDVSATARRNLETAKAGQRLDGMAASYLAGWEQILDAGVAEVARVLADPAPRACELRANSPFAGVLDEQTRLAVLGKLSRHWDARHADETSGPVQASLLGAGPVGRKGV